MTPTHKPRGMGCPPTSGARTGHGGMNAVDALRPSWRAPTCARWCTGSWLLLLICIINCGGALAAPGGRAGSPRAPACDAWGHAQGRDPAPVAHLQGESCFVFTTGPGSTSTQPRYFNRLHRVFAEIRPLDPRTHEAVDRAAGVAAAGGGEERLLGGGGATRLLRRPHRRDVQHGPLDDTGDDCIPLCMARGTAISSRRPQRLGGRCGAVTAGGAISHGVGREPKAIGGDVLHNDEGSNFEDPPPWPWRHARDRDFLTAAGGAPCGAPSSSPLPVLLSVEAARSPDYHGSQLLFRPGMGLIPRRRRQEYEVKEARGEEAGRGEAHYRAQGGNGRGKWRLHWRCGLPLGDMLCANAHGPAEEPGGGDRRCGYRCCVRLCAYADPLTAPEWKECSRRSGIRSAFKLCMNVDGTPGDTSSGGGDRRGGFQCGARLCVLVDPPCLAARASLGPAAGKKRRVADVASNLLATSCAMRTPATPWTLEERRRKDARGMRTEGREMERRARKGARMRVRTSMLGTPRRPTPHWRHRAVEDPSVRAPVSRLTSHTTEQTHAL